MGKFINSFLLALFLCGQGAFAFENIAHRGFSGKHLENSIKSVSKAWGAGATVVEIDLRLTSDGIMVLFHDEKIDGEDVGGMSLAELERKSGRVVPSFSKVLAELPKDAVLLLDLKDGSPVFVATLMSDIVRSNKVSFDQLYFQSRSMAVLNSLKQSFPSVRCLWITSLDRSGLKAPSAEILAERIATNGLYGVTAKGRQFVDAAFISAFQERGLKYFVWTVNEPDRMRRYLDLGVDGIITDWPDRLNELSN